MKTKEYVRPIESTWFLQRPTWTRFMMRELTAVFAGAYAIFLLVLAYRARDAQSFAALVQGLKSPTSVVLHVIALGMMLYHTFTWFELTPQAMPLYQGEEKVSPVWIAGTQYVLWIIVSALVAWAVLSLS